MKQRQQQECQHRQRGDDLRHEHARLLADFGI
jgi:hypothetical protein